MTEAQLSTITIPEVPAVFLVATSLAPTVIRMLEESGPVTFSANHAAQVEVVIICASKFTNEGLVLQSVLPGRKWLVLVEEADRERESMEAFYAGAHSVLPANSSAELISCAARALLPPQQVAVDGLVEAACATAKLGLMEWRPASDLVDLDARATELLGLAEAPRTLRVVLENLSEKAKGELERSLRCGQPVTLDLGADDCRRSVRTGVYTAHDSVMVFLADATAETLHGAELERARSVAQQAQEDSQKFIYAASHDLQEPLRIITGFSDLLRKRYGSQLDDAGRETLGYLADGAARMKVLLQRLLEYSRAGNDVPSGGAADARLAVDSVLFKLRGKIDQRGAKVQVGELPVVGLPETRLSQVFEHLIENALKFSEEGSPEIRVAALADGVDWRFEVSDNGIGFDMQFSERIFRPLQRLHARGVYEGSGLGLAIVERIVTHYGGRCWAESEPGRGARFFFTVPGALESKTLQATA